MKSFETLVDAIADLRGRGYIQDFELLENGLSCIALQLLLAPEEFMVDEYYRFEGFSDPDDSSIIYAITSTEGIKGTLVDAYGTYAENLSSDMLEKMRFTYRS